MVRGAEVQGAGLDVGFVCQGWEPDVGGVESHAADLACALMTRGHRVHVLCLDYAEGREPYSTHDAEVGGVAVRRMAYRYHDHAALADVVSNDRANDVVLAWLAETPCDVVHVQHATGFGLGALRSIDEVGQPLVMTLHDYWPLCPRGQMLRADGTVCAAPEPEACAECLRGTWPHLMPSTGGRGEGPSGEPIADDRAAAAARTEYALECLRRPERLFTPSARAREVYARAGLDAGSIEVVENGIEVAELAAEARRLRGEPGDGVRLGVLGSVLPSKGVLELARAFRAADAPGLTLEIHGNLPPYHGDSSYVDALRALAAEDERIRVHGPYRREELAGILAGLDGVAAPSRWEEVYGLTVREARAAGLPVLVSDTGDLAAVAAGGEAGIVVPRDDEAAWVDALRRFAGDAEAREAWAAAETTVRTSHEMMLQIERAYVEVIRDATGVMPALVHPVEGMEVEAPKKKGFFGKLFGG